MFLDRDGTLIEERHYLADPDGVVLLPGAAAGLRALRELGYALVVVTNQSGIARGLFTEADFHRVQLRLEALLAAEGVRLDGVYMCPHHPEHGGPCECRKPGLGLYRRAIAELGVDASASLFVGDRATDIEPARAFGGRGVLVRSGYGAAEARRLAGAFAVVDDLRGVAALVRNLPAGDGATSA
ncbi:MAG: HAD family hydrolase [Gemmatimonadetes bacterium]|nr:HAD family hydrolase [Gemmatimonadota bacterium]